MKKLMISLLLLTVFIKTFAQEQPIPTNQEIKTNYLQKSKSQKTAAFIFLGIGATCFAIAAPGNVSFGTLNTLVIGGAVSALVSIPLFIASSRNKRKANASAFIKLESSSFVHGRTLSNNSYPAIGLKINL